jgi:hypothetical protein
MLQSDGSSHTLYGSEFGLRTVVPKVWGAPPWGAQEILKGGSRGAKLFYSL